METQYIRQTKFNIFLVTFVQLYHIFREKCDLKFEAIKVGLMLFITRDLRSR
jgi:hypothetical protein